MKAKIIKVWTVYGYQGRKAGRRCIFECHVCKKHKEVVYSIIRKGGGIYCSIKCRQKGQSLFRTGENSNVWKGGKRKCSKTGYILIRVGNKYIREHRLKIEKKLGRKLKSWEIFHHKNGIKDDNRLKNLELVTLKTHKGKVKCPYCEQRFYIK